MKKNITNLTKLSEMLAEETNMSKADAKIVLDTTIQLLVGEFEKGNSVRLGNFGTFIVYNRQARKARNPQTGEEIKVPVKQVVKFKPTNSTKDKVNK